jgi:hypothetical protein
MTQDKQQLLQDYLRVLQEVRRAPTRSEMMAAGWNRDKIRHHFGSLTALRKFARESAPQKFENIPDTDRLRHDFKKKLPKLLRRYKRFIITTVVDGQPVHKPFLKNLKKMAEHQNALLLFLPAGKELTNLDPALAQEMFVFDDVALNTNLTIRARFRVPPKNANPLTSLPRIGQRDTSTIVASPKMFMQMVGTGNVKLPHAIMSTGAVTRSVYESKGRTNRVDYIAEHDHVVGAVVVEIEDKNIYHFRQIQAERSGSFADLSLYYADGRVGRLRPEAFVIGDIHITETDPSARKAWFEVMEETGCKHAIWHDSFSGVSINHHEADNEIKRAQLMAEGQLSLEAEIRAFAEEVNLWTSRGYTIAIVDSNHHDFLVKYLQHGMYRRDPQNLDFASKLISPAIAGENPLRYAVEKLIGIKRPDRVRWLTRDDDYRVAGIQCGAHGDLGANGKRNPGPAGMESAYGLVTYGHTHTPCIMRGAWSVGTSSRLKLGYNPGASSWFHTSCLHYSNGARQHVNSIGGNWRLRK